MSHVTMTKLTDDIVAYEQGDLDEQQMISLFQQLVNTGLAWELQGHYGRTAVDLARRGLIVMSKERQFLCPIKPCLKGH